jgi:hypothetical protein
MNLELAAPRDVSNRLQPNIIIIIKSSFISA